MGSFSSFDKDWQQWFRQKAGDSQQRGGSGSIKHQGVITRIILGVVLALMLLGAGRGLYTEWLWYDSLSYGSVYATILGSRALIFIIAATIFTVIFLGNLLLSLRLAPKGNAGFLPAEVVRRFQPVLKIVIAAVTVALALIFGSVAQGNWEVILTFLNGQPFGVTDPVFNKEISFYVFSLPFWGLVRGWFVGVIIFSLMGSVAVYFAAYGAQRIKFDYARAVAMHIGSLTGVLFVLFAGQYWLGIWELVFSSSGVVFGAGYTDMHANLPAQWIMLVAVLLCGGVVGVAIWKRRLRWAVYAIGGWFVAVIIIGGVYPGLVQRLQVQPQELVRETPYIEHNIQYTLQAYGLDDIEEQPFPAEDMPSSADIAASEATLNNVRLWDPRPLKDTYNQIQSIRLYYDFNDVDVDRYRVDGDYRQVMLSARELSAEKLAGQAQTWVNRRLQFTHGYGVVISPVNEVSTQGLPSLWAKDIPPVGDFEITRPQIYFGEKTNEYVIVKTNTPEFDYPMGDENVYDTWRGEGGVPVGGFINRLVYAWEFGDLNLLISSEINSGSELLYRRNIEQRVNALAPFLEMDSDPYLVVIDGQLYWIIDCYTVTDRYPYSEPISGGINYIRNSVKAVINAYDGSVDFYITDGDDPLIRTYASIFPDLFMNVESMPEAMVEHLRYPEDMFSIQSSVYRTYHMNDVRVFYNKEDLWAVPREVYAGSEQMMEPYYIIMRLPGEETEEFLLMLPFTPVNKNNAIGWMAARCDGENYGKLLAYSFPKDKLVYGPSQIENRIQQDTVITEQLALWGRGGSRVIRGNLLLIPLGDSKIYVEPVFLQADSGGLPELKRVIVSAGEQIVMEPSLAEGLAAIFGVSLPDEPIVTPPDEPIVTPPDEPIVTPPVSEPGDVDAEIVSLIKQAQEYFDRAQESLRNGDWAAYGQELDALKEVLRKLAELTGTE
jgi:uncharacterized protein